MADVYKWDEFALPGIPEVKWVTTLQDVLIKMSNSIFKNTFRAEGNQVFAGSHAIEKFCLLSEFRWVYLEKELKPGVPVGTISDGVTSFEPEVRWTLFVVPSLEPNAFVVTPDNIVSFSGDFQEYVSALESENPAFVVRGEIVNSSEGVQSDAY